MDAEEDGPHCAEDTERVEHGEPVCWAVEWAGAHFFKVLEEAYEAGLECAKLLLEIGALGQMGRAREAGFKLDDGVRATNADEGGFAE